MSQHRIWDGHCHLAGLPGTTPVDRMRTLVEYADRMGIEKLCVFMGMEFSFDPTPEEFRRHNDEVLEAITAFPERALGYVYVNPKYPAESVAELDRCIHNGPMVGVKLWVATHADKPELDPIVECAADLNAVIFQHTWIKITGNLPGESTPGDLVDLARRHPDANFICGHIGGDWELGVRSIRNQGNIYADIAGGDPVAGIIEMSVRDLGPERVIFGSDVPGRSFATQLGKVYGTKLTTDEQQLILGGNLRRLLRPILKKAQE